MDYVVIRQDKYREWSLPYRLKSARERLRSWLSAQSIDRACQGLRQFSQVLESHAEIVRYVEDLYIELRGKREIIMDFKEFSLYMYGYKPINGQGEYKYPSYRPNLEKDPSYLKKPHHKPKEWTDAELTKQAWREHKGIARDKAKPHWGHGAKKKMVNFEHKWNRQDCRRKLKSGDWENITFHQDTWLWD